MPHVAGVVRAGGRSRRMGADKAGIMLDGRTLLARAVERLAPQVGGLALNLEALPPSFDLRELPLLRDRVPGHAGPLAGILAGMEWAAAGGFSDVVSVAVDTPFFPRDLVVRLISARVGGQGVIVAASGGRQHPVFMLAPVDLRTDLEAFIARGGSRVSEWLERHRASTVEFPVNGALDPFFNINTPDDLARATTLSACAAP